MDIRKIAVFGAGVMGTGITQDAAAHGLEVVLVDRMEGSLTCALKRIESNLDRELERWGITTAEKKLILSRITCTTEYREALDTSIVVEAIPDDLATKRIFFAQLENGCNETSPHKIMTFVSTTAILPITDIAQDMVDKTRLVGMQFFTPVPSTRVAGVTGGIFTSQEAVSAAGELARRMDKSVVAVHENPGYLTARLIVPFINEAITLYQEGTATKENIDTAMHLGFGFDKGPFALADEIGLDVILGWSEYLFHESGEMQYHPQALLRGMVRQHHLGAKTGEGFYVYMASAEKSEETK